MAATPGQELRSLEVDLTRIAKGIEKDLKAELKDVGKIFAAKIRASTQPPFWHQDRAREPGDKSLRKSVKVGITRGNPTLYSTLPQASVWEWGGTISPRGHQIRIPRTQFVHGPIERDRNLILLALGNAFDRTARKHGFH